MLEIGSVLNEKYKILKDIGRGGICNVYLALDEKTKKQRAVKEICKKEICNVKQVMNGINEETNFLRKLDHPNLPKIIDVIDTDESFIIIMEYIEGVTLDSIINEYGAQSVEEVVEWGKQICDALKYLHSFNPPVLYIDLKPSNVMLKPDGNIALVNHGLFREYQKKDVTDTLIFGTRGYAPPEAYFGKYDLRSDIYVLGATLYHLVTGHSPAEPPYEIYPIRHWNPQLSAVLEAIIKKCTQLNPNDRYQSCDELLFSLEHYNCTKPVLPPNSFKMKILRFFQSISSILFYRR